MEAKMEKMEMEKTQTSISCGGVVIHKGKALLLYRSARNKYDGWVLPKGKQEPRETYEHTALREVREEAGATARLLGPLGHTQYTFTTGAKTPIRKVVYWYLMAADNFYCKPQTEECFADVGFYKQHEAYHLLKYNDERNILCRAFGEYVKRRQSRLYTFAL